MLCLMAQIRDEGIPSVYPARVFARKIVVKALDPMASENEQRAIKKLCDGRNENMVDVFGVGTFVHNDASYMYIDQELCDFTLSDYIEWNAKTIKALHDPKTEMIASKSSTWNIMKQITSGLAFLNRHKQIHRDMKPQNCSQFSFFFFFFFQCILTVSPVLLQTSFMEVDGLWHHDRGVCVKRGVHI